VPVAHAKIQLNRRNESPLQGENADFRPPSKFNPVPVKTKVSNLAAEINMQKHWKK